MAIRSAAGERTADGQFMAHPISVEAKFDAGISAANDTLAFVGLAQLPQYLPYHSEEQLGIVGFKFQAKK